jgi:hypothetical protein
VSLSFDTAALDAQRLHSVFVPPGSTRGRPVRIDGSHLAKVIAGLDRERRREGQTNQSSQWSWPCGRAAYA